MWGGKWAPLAGAAGVVVLLVMLVLCAPSKRSQQQSVEQRPSCEQQCERGLSKCAHMLERSGLRTDTVSGAPRSCVDTCALLAQTRDRRARGFDVGDLRRQCNVRP